MGYYKIEEQEIVLPLMIFYTNIYNVLSKQKPYITKKEYEKLCIENKNR